MTLNNNKKLKYKLIRCCNYYSNHNSNSNSAKNLENRRNKYFSEIIRQNLCCKKRKMILFKVQSNKFQSKISKILQIQQNEYKMTLIFANKTKAITQFKGIYRTFIITLWSIKKNMDSWQQILQQQHQIATNPHMRSKCAGSKAMVMIWKGDVEGAMEYLDAENALNADFVSMAAAAGRHVWERVVRLYVQKLIASGEMHMAAMHLLSVNDVYSALDVYREHNMIHEAVALGAAQLMPQDPYMCDLYKQYALQLDAQGHKAAAVQYFIAGWDYASAVKCIAQDGSTDQIEQGIDIIRLVQSKEQECYVPAEQAAELEQLFNQLQSNISSSSTV
eukprot:TRINITY_DN10351_c0_g1_i1.p2 TRINITY_DN10351_c0_g1~~TRINITY_DN10351_c0_g1_i1.p2  ORF type:complete len:333 (+),score=34.52 TRINITY_DN10351_c0_g1_i1:619-1617(+)